MSRLFLVLVGFSLLAVDGCTSDDANSPAGTPGTPDDSDAGNDTTTGGRPSGALVRVFNAYAPLNGEPAPVDIYPKPFVLEGAKPTRTQAYGAMSEPFDPTVADEAGDMFISFYWANTTGNGTALMSKTETLKGGEYITYFLTTGSEKQEDTGRRFGAIHAYFHNPPPGSDGDVPPGKGLVTVDTIGLDEVLSNASSMNLFFSVGTGCTKGVNDSEFTTTGVGPGSAGTFALAPGEYTGTVYDDIDCAKNPLASAKIAVTEGTRTVFFIYAPKDGDVRNIVVPLQPKTP
jgi:hypothetical protein